jgi:hypothetical protein
VVVAGVAQGEPGLVDAVAEGPVAERGEADQLAAQILNLGQAGLAARQKRRSPSSNA